MKWAVINSYRDWCRFWFFETYEQAIAQAFECGVCKDDCRAMIEQPRHYVCAGTEGRVTVAPIE